MGTEKRLPQCKFGAECYRKNPEHLLEFWHPGPGIETGTSKPDTEPSNFLLPDVSPPTSHGPRDSNALVLLMLVGPPGSGKSTFCQKVLQNAARPWTRICQDVISSGKRGTKAQCLKLAGTALSAGRSILIDRCNIDDEQRKEFLQLAKERGIEAHALVLNLPVSVCIQRASQRTGHEGGLNGANVGAVVNRVARTRKPPNLEEGFVRITYCRTDAEVQNTITLYSQLDPRDHLSAGVFGASVQEGKGTLRSLLQNAGRDVKMKTTSEQQALQTSLPSSGGCTRQSNNNDETISEKTEKIMLGMKDAGEKVGAKSLAFPSVSTADFQFDHDMAATIIVETATAFHTEKDHVGLRLVLVDLSANSDMLARVRKKAAEAGLNPLQLLTHAGDITKLCTSGGPQCNFIANATNWRLKPGGGGVNAAIFKAAGAGLEEATRECARTLSPGDAMAVALPASSPLRRDEGVTHVIHVLGPNMNSQRPNCLAGDYKQGCEILRATYTRLFETFSSITKKDQTSLDTNHVRAAEHARMEAGGDGTRCKTGGRSETGNLCKSAPANAFTMLMQAAKRKGTGDIESNTKRQRPGVVDDKKTDKESNEDSVKMDATSDMVCSGGPAVQEIGQGRTTPSLEDRSKKTGEDRPARKWGTWAQALRDIALHPEQHPKAVLQITDDAVVFPDMYSKGKKHLLIVARSEGLESIDDVRMEHLPVLKHLHSLGETWARSYLKEDPTLVFRLGYHSVPSMRQLHMHVISQDFDSPNLKNKKHWNSFTTGFFRASQDILAEVEEIGRVRPCSTEDEGKYLGMELRCHRCRSAQPNMPRLKAHLQACKTMLQRPDLITSSST